MKQKAESKCTLKFIDRDDIRSKIDCACQRLLEDMAHFEIVSIYGMGGIGKTQLLKETFGYNSFPGLQLIYTTLEISSKDDLLDILIKFRKALPSNRKYPLFDYAILHIWKQWSTSKLDEDFLQSTVRNVINAITPPLDVSVGLTAGWPMASIIESLLRVSDNFTKFCRHKKVKRIIGCLTEMSPHELLSKLPILLGEDICHAFSNDPFVLVVDSYKEYAEDQPSSKWLISLITQIKCGVYVISSREEISWPQSLRDYVTSVSLEELPAEEVRQELSTQLCYPKGLIENIIQVTKCVPIYLDLAVRALSEMDEKAIEEEDVFFDDEDDIIQRFLFHLSANERKVIIVLAVVQIFDQVIFEELVRKLHLQVDFLCFDAICKRSLVKNYERDDHFYKIHDVISENILKTQEEKNIQRILQAYLDCVTFKVSKLYNSLQTNMLLKNIIKLYGKTGLHVPEHETECILDLYFMVKESLLPFDCDSIDGFKKSKSLKNLYLFLSALSKERSKSSDRLARLNEINESACAFGKHCTSLKLMKGYLQALCEGTQFLKTAIEEINKTLTDKEQQEWYYGQSKIFHGDCLVSYGDYITGMHVLRQYEEIIPHLVGKENDAFQVHRHIGHAYRFNMMLPEAEHEYRGLIYGENVSPTNLQRVYILTNLCETYCYFKPDEVFSILRETLTLTDAFHDLKSKGKVYYSLAIALTQERKYGQAKKCIEKSLAFNQEDGYLAGQLYAYMAQAYLEYAHQKKVTPRTVETISAIQKKIQVYSCFQLPIVLMQKDYSRLSEIQKSQKWLDFNRTVSCYRTFLDSLC